MQFYQEYFGRKLAALQQLATILYLASCCATSVVAFIYPPFGSELLSTAVFTWIAVLLNCNQSGTYISNQEPRWLTKRASMVFTLSACWLEAGTDLASGVSAL